MAGDAAPPPPDLPADSGPQPLLQLLASLTRDLPGLVSDRVQLLSLELRRAGLALAQIIALVVAIGILAVTAWIALWYAAAAALLAWGLHGAWVLAIVLVLNLGAATIAASRVRVLLRLLGLPATVRRLTVPEPASGEPAMPTTAEPGAA